VALLSLASCAQQYQREAENTIALGDQSSPADLYAALAGEYYKLGQLDVALQQANKAIAADQQNPRGYYMIGLIHERTGQSALAEANFKQALERAPRNSDVLNAYGNFFCTQRRFPEAQVQFAKAIENPLYGTPWIAMTNAGTCAASAGNEKQAEADYRRALGINPQFGPALMKLAELELKRDNATGAKALLDRYFKANAPEPQVLLLAVRTERALSNAKAAATYEQLLRQRYPDAPEIRDL
jgi:type IV pilus assembly protein PilF